MKDRDQYVYIISDGEYHKIGYAYNPATRLKELQTGNARVLTIIHVIKTDNMVRLESLLHKTLYMFFIRGEWYRLPIQIIEYIQSFDSFYFKNTSIDYKISKSLSDMIRLHFLK